MIETGLKGIGLVSTIVNRCVAAATYPSAVAEEMGTSI